MMHGFGSSHGGFPVDQNGRVVLSTGHKKHLNLILEDRSIENSKTYDWQHPLAGFTLSKTGIADLGPTSDSTASDVQQQETATPKAELALKIRSRRTPAGQFFTSINTALVDRPDPPRCYDGENLTHTALRSSAGALKELVSTSSQQPKTSATAATAAHQARSTTGAVPAERGPAPWLMPWQTQDRKQGRIVADQVRTKRAPSGSFSSLTLAKG